MTSPEVEELDALEFSIGGVVTHSVRLNAPSNIHAREIILCVIDLTPVLRQTWYISQT